MKIEEGYAVVDGTNFVIGDATPFFTTKPAALDFIESRLIRSMYIVPMVRVTKEEAPREQPQPQQQQRHHSELPASAPRPFSMS
jgi:hypothetical protein